MPKGLTQVEVAIESGWSSKIVTTDPPRYTPHTEWWLAIRLRAAARVRVVALLVDRDETAWGLQPGGAKQEAELRASFFPYDWNNSNDVLINFGYQRAAVTDPNLKSDPRNVVTVEQTLRGQTGTVINIAELPAHAISLAMFVVAEEDVEVRRLHRWRIKPRVGEHLPKHLLPLTSGHQTGVTRT